MTGSAAEPMTVSFDLPVDRTAAEVIEALQRLGATRIRIYVPPSISSAGCSDA